MASETSRLSDQQFRRVRTQLLSAALMSDDSQVQELADMLHDLIRNRHGYGNLRFDDPWLLDDIDVVDPAATLST